MAVGGRNIDSNKHPLTGFLYILQLSFHYLSMLWSKANLCAVKLLFFFFAEAADITVAAHRSWRAKQAGLQPGYLPYPLLGVGNTVINLLFSWRRG